jgi:2-polyprenyl-3-methyl-5-hydroxy-6-metoxy-1,4-benzoquinol methylase
MQGKTELPGVLNMQEIECPLCDSTASVQVAVCHDRLLDIEGQFKMVHCTHCGLHYLNPQPTTAELERYYPEGYDPFQMPSLDQVSYLQRLSVEYGLRKRRRAVTRYQHSGSLLEIGCGTGLFLDAMRRMGGWQLKGVEVSELAARNAQERLELDVFHGQLEDAKYPDHSFDVVVMWDVLEHVHNPKQTLFEINRILAPDGLLVCRVPLLNGWDRRLFGPYWAGWDAPRHLTVFSMHTLTMMLAHTGFRVRRAACISGSYPAFQLSLRFWAKENLSEPAQRRLRLILGALPTRVMAAPIFYLLDKLVKCTTATLFAIPARRGG